MEEREGGRVEWMDREEAEEVEERPEESSEEERLI